MGGEGIDRALNTRRLISCLSLARYVNDQFNWQNGDTIFLSSEWLGLGQKREEGSSFKQSM